MKICYWHTQFHPVYSGHVEQLDLIRRHLNRKKVEPVIWSVRTEQSMPENDVYAGIPVRRFGPPGPETWKHYARFLNAARALLTEPDPFDLLHLNGLNHMTRFFPLMTWLKRKPVVVHMTLLGDDDPVSQRGGRLSTLVSRIQSLIPAWISISAGLTERYLESGLDTQRLHEIPIAVDTGRFRPAQDKRQVRRALGLPEDRPIVLGVGQVIRRKGFDWLLEVAELVVRTHPQALFVIVGPKEVLSHEHEPLADWIEQQAAARGISDTIRLVGRSGQVAEYMQAADVFAFPSRQEGFGIVAAEAAASQLPVVMFDLPGITCELVKEGKTGYVLPLGDIQGMASRLSALLADPDRSRAMGVAGRARVASHLDLEQICAQYEALYERLL